MSPEEQGRDDDEFLRALFRDWPEDVRFWALRASPPGLVPMLLDKSLPRRHWSRTAMFGPEGRAGWVEPDLQPFPF